jgi:hypothetical protein
MLIPDSTFTWMWASALAVAVLAGIYYKFTGLAYFRRGYHLIGLKRLGVTVAIVAVTLTVFIHFQYRGNRLWLYQESSGRLTWREFVLFGSAAVPLRDGRSLAVEEVRGGGSDGTRVIVNDTGRPLKVPLGYHEGKEVVLAAGLSLKTTDYFYHDAEFAP